MGGDGGDVNVHVTLQMKLVNKNDDYVDGDDDDDDDDDDETCKFRDEISSRN